MPSLILFRDTPITEAEIAKLPTGCYPVENSNQGIIAMAQIQGPVLMLIQLAVEMGRAIPNATFGYEEDSSTSHATHPSPAVKDTSLTEPLAPEDKEAPPPTTQPRPRRILQN